MVINFDCCCLSRHSRFQTSCPNVALTFLFCPITTHIRVSSINSTDFQLSAFQLSFCLHQNIWRGLFTLLVTVCFQIFHLVQPQERKGHRTVRGDNRWVSISFTQPMSFFCALQLDKLFSNWSFNQIRWSASLKPLFYALSKFTSLPKLRCASLSYIWSIQNKSLVKITIT